MRRAHQLHWLLVEDIIVDACTRFKLIDKLRLRTLANKFFCDDPQLTILHLAELLSTLPAAFQYLNCLFQHRAFRVELARRSPIACFVLKTPELSRIICLEPLRNLLPSFHNFSTIQLRHVLIFGAVGILTHDVLERLAVPELQDCLAQLAQDLLDSRSTSRSDKRTLLGFLRRCGGVPPSLFLPSLKEGDMFVTTALSDLYNGVLDGLRVIIKKPRYNRCSLDNAEILREVVLHRRCHHPHILGLLGVGEGPGPHRLYGLVTPYMKHGNIVQFLKHNPDVNRLTPIWQIIQGLAYLHSFDPPIVHRDIKGENVLIDDDLSCRLADFGISSIPELSRRSHEHVIGTPAWMAPEILFPPSHGRVDLLKVDTFALGITAYEVYEGKPPTSDASFCALVVARYLGTETLFFPPNTFPLSLARLIEDMCNPEPSNRPNVPTILERFKSSLIFPKKIRLREETNGLNEILVIGVRDSEPERSELDQAITYKSEGNQSKPYFLSMPVDPSHKRRSSLLTPPPTPYSCYMTLP